MKYLLDDLLLGLALTRPEEPGSKRKNIYPTCVELRERNAMLCLKNSDFLFRVCLCHCLQNTSIINSRASMCVNRDKMTRGRVLFLLSTFL